MLSASNSDSDTEGPFASFAETVEDYGLAANAYRGQTVGMVAFITQLVRGVLGPPLKWASQEYIIRSVRQRITSAALGLPEFKLRGGTVVARNELRMPSLFNEHMWDVTKLLLEAADLRTAAMKRSLLKLMLSCVGLATVSELSGVSAERCCASAICDNRRRTCRSVLSGRCRSAARLDGASLLACSNMARTIADDDGQKTSDVCPDQPHG
jgi:hypothetical protein